MRLATHATSCDSDTRFTIFFMFATSSCTSSTMHVHCTCTQGRNCTPFVYVACRMSQKLNFLQLLRQVHCDSLRQLATARDRQFLVATVANRVSRRRKLYCESGLKRDSQKLFCDATRDATGAKPGNPQIAAMSHPTQLTQLGHRMPSQKLSLAQLLRCDAMRQAIWCTILTFSTAKLYKGARVAYKFVQVVSNRANIMVTYPNQQNFVASLTSSVNGISRVRIARIRRRSRRIACRIAEKLL